MRIVESEGLPGSLNAFLAVDYWRGQCYEPCGTTPGNKWIEIRLKVVGHMGCHRCLWLWWRRGAEEPVVSNLCHVSEPIWDSVVRRGSPCLKCGLYRWWWWFGLSSWSCGGSWWQLCSTLLCFVEDVVEISCYCLSVFFKLRRWWFDRTGSAIRTLRWCIPRLGSRCCHEACFWASFLQSPVVCDALKRFGQWWRIGRWYVWKGGRCLYLC